MTRQTEHVEWAVRRWTEGNFEVETRRKKSPQEQEENRRSKLEKIARSLPLVAVWNCYFDKCERTTGAPAFPDSLRLLSRVETVAGLWQLHDGSPKPSQLADTCHGVRASCGYYFFRDPIPPIWEDERHSGGGKLLLTGPNVSSPRPLDDLWKRLLMCCAGGDSGSKEFPDAVQSVLGCTLTVKKDGWKMSVWIPKSTPGDVRKLGAWLSTTYEVEPRHVVYFPHRNTGTFTSKPSPPRHQMGVSQPQNESRQLEEIGRFAMVHDDRLPPQRAHPTAKGHQPSFGGGRRLYRREHDR